MNTLTYAEGDIPANARLGDVIYLHGQRVRITKKTNYALAVEPYHWYDTLGEWLLEKLNTFLP